MCLGIRQRQSEVHLYNSMLITFQVLECLRGTSPTSSTTDSPRRDTPTDDIESECVFFLCLFVFVCSYTHFDSGEALHVGLFCQFEEQSEKWRDNCVRSTAREFQNREEFLCSWPSTPLSFCSRRFLLISPTNRISMSDLFVCFFVQKAHSQGSQKLRFHGRRLTGQLPRGLPMQAFLALISSGKQSTRYIDN